MTMFRKSSIFLFLTSFCLFSIISGSPAGAATPKAGAACTKLGSKSSGLVCAKVNGKLKWQIVKKAQTLTFELPTQATVNEKSVTAIFSSSSGLPVKIVISTPDICSLGKSEILLAGSPGKCQITLAQAGNSKYLAAVSKTLEILVFGINEIDFELPGALLLSQGTYELSATSSANLPISFSSDTPEFCNVQGSTLTLVKIGKCTVTASQSGSEFFPPAKAISSIVEVSGIRVTADLPDTFPGFQVKAIYVVPSDGVDNSLDTNGTIAHVLDEGTDYLKGQLNLTIPIDLTTTGYDIAFLKSSMPSSYFLNTAGTYAELLQESKLLDAPGSNRKSYIFFVDTDTVVSPAYCGQAPRPGMSAIVAIGANECGKATAFFDNYAGQTWVHELFHNLGVDHVADSCDLMTSGQAADGPPCPANQLLTIDKNRSMYFGASLYGQDISKLRVWSGHTLDKELLADCSVSDPDAKPLADGLKFAYCPTGTQTVGPIVYCWSFIDTDSLEELINGAWVSLGAAGGAYQPWGNRLDWKCGDTAYVGPSKQVTVDTPGIHHYRWVIDGEVKEEFKIIWVA
jgi:hypothetical protein